MQLDTCGTAKPHVVGVLPRCRIARFFPEICRVNQYVLSFYKYKYIQYIHLFSIRERLIVYSKCFPSVLEASYFSRVFAGIHKWSREGYSLPAAWTTSTRENRIASLEQTRSRGPLSEASLIPAESRGVRKRELNASTSYTLTIPVHSRLQCF